MSKSNPFYSHGGECLKNYVITDTYTEKSQSSHEKSKINPIYSHDGEP